MVALSLLLVGLVPVRFEVTLPPSTPPGEIYLCGSADALGKWNGPGLKLKRKTPTLAVGSARLPDGAKVEFKATRGSWATVEKDAACGEISNRSIRAEKKSTVRIEVAAWADSCSGATDRGHTLSGDIRFHRNFASKHLGNSRTISVYLPPGYDSSADRYAVLYMHDGQNVFDAATSFIGVEWGVDEACEKLIASGGISPIIVVGIDNAGGRRALEYTPVRDRKDRRDGGDGDLYLKFVTEEVKPFIDRTYRTRPDRASTTVMGSSLGGLISLHMAWKRPDLFGHAGIVSPALWWGDNEIIRRIEKANSAPEPRPRIWLDMGTAEGDTHERFSTAIMNNRRLADALEKKGYARGRDLEVVEVEGADHSERAWHARIEDILKFFFRR